MPFRCTTLSAAELRRFQLAVHARADGAGLRFVLSVAEAHGGAEHLRRIVTVRCGDACRHYAGDDAGWIDAALADIAAGVFGSSPVDRAA